MNEDEILSKIISDLNSRYPSSVDIRTDGGDQTVDPPEIIITWNTSDLDNESGHKPDTEPIYIDSGYGEDGFGSGGYGIGSLDGIRRTEYRQMSLSLMFRYEDELNAMSGARPAETYFKTFEDSPSMFDDDTYSWDIGGLSPSDTPFVEPDWYAVDLPVEFKYSKHYDDTTGYAVIEDIIVDVDATE